MCIIAAKPAGIAMPSTETIDNMWFRNHDGAGFMYASGGNVHIEKGFMKLEDFKNALERVSKAHDLTATPMVMHFRIATHGGVLPANTHPFPVTTSVGILQKLVCNTKLGVAHNGIISGVTPRKGISDTMEYIASQLGLLYKAVPEFYKNSNLMEMIDNAIGSKLAFLTSEGQIHTVGHFEEDNGILYSNTSYKPYNDFQLGKWDKDTKKWVYSCYANYDTYYDDYPWYKDDYCVAGTILVRMVGEHEDEYVVTDKGLHIGADECDMVVDSKGNVYKYADDYTGIISRLGWRAYRSDGSQLKADVNANDGYVFYEDVLVDVVYEEDEPPKVPSGKHTYRHKKKHHK